jgi:peptide/nickel transport system permease protein
MTMQPAGPELAETESFAERSAEDAPTIAGRSPASLAWSRLRRDRVTFAALVLLVIAAIIGLLAPLMLKIGWIDPYTFHQNLVGGIGSVPTGRLGGISGSHWLGVEPQTGRDVLSRVVYGITLSLLLAISATTVSVVIGTIFGLISGYLGRWPDFWISRTVDLVLAFPQLLMLLALSSVIQDRITALGVPAGNTTAGAYLILVLGFFGWPYFARVVRGQVLSLREREFIEAAKSVGATRRRIYFKELLPNLWAPILIFFTLNVPVNISTEAALSYLGVGIRAPTPTLGNVLTDSSTFATADFTFFFLPALVIFLLVLGFNLLGDGLRDALDPKSSR